MAKQQQLASLLNPDKTYLSSGSSGANSRADGGVRDPEANGNKRREETGLSRGRRHAGTSKDPTFSSRITAIRLVFTVLIVAKFLWRWYLIYRQRQHYAARVEIPSAFLSYVNASEWDASRRLNMGINPFKPLIVGPYVALLAALWLGPLVLKLRSKLWKWLLRCWSRREGYQLAAMAQQPQQLEEGEIKKGGSHRDEQEDGHQRVVRSVASSTLVENWRRSCLWHGIFLIVATVGLYLYLDFICKALIHHSHSPIVDAHLTRRVEALLAEFQFPNSSFYVLPEFENAGHLGGILTHPVIIIGEPLLLNVSHSGSSGLSKVVDADNDDNGDNNNGFGGHSSVLKNDEVLAFIGHELGHWIHGHGLVRCVMRELELLVIVVVAFLLRNCAALYATFGYYQRADGGPTPWLITRCAVVAFYVLLLLNEVYTPLANLLYWKMERQADAFVAGPRMGMGRPLCSGLVTLHHGRLLVMDPLFAAYYADHPSVEDRVLAVGCQRL